MSFRAPVRDIAHALGVVGFDGLRDLPAFAELDGDTTTAVLDAAGAFASERLAPLNRVGDTVGARYENGAVFSPPGFPEAYRDFAAGGWCGLSAEMEYGGQGLPKALELAVYEMVHSANLAFGLCPVLNVGAIEALQEAGTARQKSLFLPPLIDGRWTGTMNLTEPQAGSDLAALTARAEPAGEGRYKLYGEKIFITWGEHDVADNIVHLVLARLPGAPAGVKGISLFIAPKFLVGADGKAGARNGLRAASIEHKLGIHASPTCVMLYDGAEAELMGQANEGLAVMFVMMNAARLQVGMQGVGIGEMAYQRALAYALDRKQGRAALSKDYPARIFDHPEVRRSLLLMKAQVEAARAIVLMAGVFLDRARHGQSEADRAAAQARADLLTPIAKAWSTDMGVAVASAGLQVYGGMGFVEETGAAQYYRDARITPIYEGTNAIQANDLVGRKLGDGGNAALALIAEIAADAKAARADARLGAVASYLEAAATALEKATHWQLAHRGAEGLAGASAYLALFGDTLGGWLLLRGAQHAPDGAWGQNKAVLADLFATQILSLAPGRAEAAMTGAAALTAIDAEALVA
ncbi:MAG TPA: acyl-CoA dehydrogenase [Caulobacterales bacterium]|nr:acyl-CoA dehydrogenase [Caulobacterales bacterium]